MKFKTMSESSKGSPENKSSSYPEDNNDLNCVVYGSGSHSLIKRAQPQTSTRVSLLVEALLKNVIAIHETDTHKAIRTYRRICKRLNKMGLIDESWSMDELEDVRAQFDNSLMRLLVNSGLSRSPSLGYIWPPADLVSQYKREFEQIKWIGGGGFGKVFRVKHKLDGSEYAVKKIPIRSEYLNSIKSYISEVKTIASMNHPNIVQYKAAWIELGPAYDDWLSVPVGTDCTESPNTNPIRFSKQGNRNTHSSYCSMSKRDPQSNFEIVFEHSMDSPTNSSSSVPRQRVISQTRVPWATLYIQMVLCHSTLGQWMRQRNERFNKNLALVPQAGEDRNKVIMEILCQILKGLQYIHSRGVVHHDVKPNNIFVSQEGNSLLVQLGDFGLACPLQRHRHAFGRGTPLYAAPEQLSGRCDPKNDMYSVGIVLFELLESFGTDMERIKRIQDLRGRDPPLVPHEYSLPNLVDALVRRRPEERPDASTLLAKLEQKLAKISSPKVEALQLQLLEKDQEIQRLTNLLKKHGIN